MLKSYIHLKPLVDSASGAYCHLLEINETKILINCGISKSTTISTYTEIIDTIMSCDAILITSFELRCIGALQYILSKSYFNNIYMTLPVRQLGSVTLMEFGNSMKNAGVHLYDYEDVLRGTNIIDIKFMQPATVNDISLCAFNAGNSIGNTLFKISRGIENIYIGIDINHRKENHLDGIDLRFIENPFLFITNSDYVYQESIPLVKRDEGINNFIKNALSNKKRIIVATKYTRLLELMYILNDMNRDRTYKVVCHSRYCKSFIERTRSMIEWVGANAVDSLSERSNPFQFINIEFIEYYSKLKDFDICIIVDEDFYSLGSSTLINKYNTENTLLIFTDENKEREFMCNVDSLRVYKIDGRYVAQSVDNSNAGDEGSFLTSSESNEEIDKHWSVVSGEVWVTKFGDGSNLSSKIEDEYISLYYNNAKNKEQTFRRVRNEVTFFHPRRRCRAYDDYGEYLNYDNFEDKKVVTEEKEEIINIQEDIYIEDFIQESTGITLKLQTCVLDLIGMSDLKSIKTIIQNIQPQKVVIVPSDDESSKMMYHTLAYKKDIKEIYELKEPLNLSFDVALTMVKLSPEFIDLPYCKISTDLLAQFTGIREGNHLQYLEAPESIMVGMVDINELKKKFLENGMTVTVKNNVLVVEDTVSIIIEDKCVFFEGDASDLYYNIRQIFYQNIAII